MAVDCQSGGESLPLTVTGPAGNVVTYEYDSSGQRIGMVLNVDGTDVMDLDYTHADGRLTQIDSNNVGGAVPAATYSYACLANSNLLEGLTHNNGTDDVLTTDRTYAAADRLLSISSSTLHPTPSTVSSCTYQLDAQGRRIKRTDADGTWIDYTYNNRDELIGAVRSGFPADNVRGRPYDYGYEFDDIGNHLKQTKNGTVLQDATE